MRNTLIFILVLISCRESFKPQWTVEQMDSILSDFSVKWIADSLGQNDFRLNHYRYDTIKRTCLIDEMDFRGYHKDQITKWFGEPSDIGMGREDKLLIMIFPVGRSDYDPDKDLIFYFDKDDNLIDIVRKIGLPK